MNKRDQAFLEINKQIWKVLFLVANLTSFFIAILSFLSVASRETIILFVICDKMVYLPICIQELEINKKKY